MATKVQAASKPRELIFERLYRRVQFLQSRTLFVDHRRRRSIDEVGIRQLIRRLLPIAFEFLDLAVESVAFGVLIDEIL